MDPGGETTPTSRTRDSNPSRDPPLASSHGAQSAFSDPSLDLPFDLAGSDGAQSAFLPRKGGRAMDADKETSHPSQLTEDVQPEAKRARSKPILTAIQGPRRRRNWPEPYWMKPEFIRYQAEEQDLELLEHARRVGQLFRAHFQGLKKLDVGIKEDKKVLSEKTGEVMQCDAGEGYATTNLENVGHLTELASQQENAKLPEGLPCSNSSSNNSSVEYCMSDEFIEHLDRKAKLYFSRVKKLPQKQIIVNGFQYMNEEAFVAFKGYVEENDLFEGFDYQFGELLHHCFSVEEYRKVYCHYNFTIEMKKKDEEGWTSSPYFAEAKLMHGVKYYFCSPLKLTDDGHCYSCTNQRVYELKHPSGGGYEKGREGSGSYYSCADSSDDD